MYILEKSHGMVEHLELFLKLSSVFGPIKK